MQNTYKKDYDDRFTRLPNLQQFRILSRQIIGSQAMRSQGMAFVYLNLKSPRSRAEEANDDDLLLETVVQAVQATFQGRIVARLSKYHLAVVTTNIGYVNLLVENGFVTKPSQNSLCKIIG